MLSDNEFAAATPIRSLIGQVDIAPLGVFTSENLYYARGADQGVGVSPSRRSADQVWKGLFYRWELWMHNMVAPAGGVTGYSSFYKPGSPTSALALGSGTIVAGNQYASISNSLQGVAWALNIANQDAVVTVTVRYIMRIGCVPLG